MKKNSMKKFVMLTAAAALAAVTLAGCGSSAADASAALEQDAQTAGQSESSAESAAESKADGASKAAGESKADGEGRLAKIKAAGKITMATSPDFAPFEFEDISSGEKKIVGSDIELGKYIAEKLGVELVIEPMDFAACEAAVSTGAVDMSISGYSPTPERAENMGMTHTYQYEEGDGKSQGLLVKKDRAEELSTKEAFAGKKIAAQNGALQQGLVKEQLPDAAMETIKNVNDGVMMLETGKIDALAVATSVGEQYLKNHPDLVMSDFYFTQEDTGNVILIPKEDQDLIDAINPIMDEIEEKGLYVQWYQDALKLAESLGLD